MDISIVLLQVKIEIRSLFIKFASLFFKPQNNKIAFIPHGGMYDNGYDLSNYKSDNSLSLLIYIINTYGNKYSYRIACDSRHLTSIENDAKKRYPNLDIACVHFFGPKNFQWSSYKELIKSKVIFASEGYSLPFKRKWHRVVFLSYFKPFKDDYKNHILERKIDFKDTFDYCISTSSIYSNIVAHTYNVPYSRFVNLGFSRDDELLGKYNCPSLDNFIRNSVDYEVKKVFLYTPTHRDYEESKTGQRELLGFKVDKVNFERFLRNNGVLIICKIHTKQNSEVFDSDQLEGVVVHKATADYGLCELLQRADCLLTDYTSTYFDYLLLDRPVLFNFYDYDKYKKTRGFSFDPLEPIIAGDIFTNENTFYTMTKKVVDGVDEYGDKRKFVRDLMHKYKDTYTSKRICEFIFGK